MDTPPTHSTERHNVENSGANSGSKRNVVNFLHHEGHFKATVWIFHGTHANNVKKVSSGTRPYDLVYRRTLVEKSLESQVQDRVVGVLDPVTRQASFTSLRRTVVARGSGVR